jgi:hypothetical protein
VNAGFSFHPVFPHNPFNRVFFSYGFAALFIVYVQFTDGRQNATKTVLLFMSFETGGAHPLAM